MKNVQRARVELGVVRDLLRPLVIDVEDDVHAALEPAEDLRLRCPVLLLVNEGMLDKFPVRNHLVEDQTADEVVALPRGFAGARRARGVRDGEVEVDADRLELLANLVDQRRLPGARGTRDDEEGPVGVEVTRHSAPVRGSSRPRFSILQRRFGASRSATSSPSC